MTPLGFESLQSEAGVLQHGPPQAKSLPCPSVLVEQNDLRTTYGSLVLSKLNEYVTVEPDEASDGLILGLALPSAPSSLIDIKMAEELVCSRFVALSRAKLYWMLPVWSQQTDSKPITAQIPVETQFLLLEIQEHKDYALLLPLIDKDAGFRCSLRPSMVVRAESGDEAVKTSSIAHALFCISGSDPFQLIERGVQAAARISGSAQPRQAKETPALLDSFGWCSWDAFYTEVNPAGLQAGLNALAAGDCPAGWVIIDDGWQQTQLDAEFRKEGPLRGLTTSMRNLSLAQLRSRRAGADAVFQDLQITAPLRAIEEEKTVALHAAQQYQIGAFAALRHGIGMALTGDFRSLVNLPRRWASAAWAVIDSTVNAVETMAMKTLQKTLEGTQSDSTAIEVFTAMATGPFRKPLLRFYASASSHSRRLLSVKANGKFNHIDSGSDAPLESQSSNFGDVIAELKHRTGVRYVICWHAMSGYWSGLMPGAPEVTAFDPEITFPRPSPGVLEVDASMKWVHPAVVGVGMPKRPHALHAAMHSYLKESNVDGVKVDVQATVAMFGWNCGGYAAQAKRYHDSLEDSVAAHLPGNLILNSMCCDMETIYNLKYSALARVGEDFYPTIKASHTAHIANAAFTSLMIGPIANLDWDMFHSVHEAAELHAATRAVSGGLVYVSDRVNEHDFNILRRLVLPDGSILRALLPARPTADCLFCDVSRDRKTVLKIWNMNAVTGIIGAFNVQGATWDINRRNYVAHDSAPPALQVAIKPADVPCLQSSTNRFAMYSDHQKKVRVKGPADAWDKILLPGRGGFDLFVISPVIEVVVEGRNGSKRVVEIAPIGLINMFNSGGAIVSAHAVPAALAMIVKGCGEFLVYASVEPRKVVVGDQCVQFEYDEEEKSVRFELPPHYSVRSGAGEVMIKF